MHINRLSKIFYLVAITVITIAFCLFVTHTYFGEESIRPAQNMLPPASHFLNDNATEFNLAIMSDTGSHNRVIERIIDAAQASDKNPEFIMYLGDLVSDRRPANFYWMFHEMGRHLNGIPFYMIPGNHDVEKRKNIDKRYYQAVVGQTYYWFGYGNTLFIAMDSSDKISEIQFEWLAETLEFIRPLFRNCIIFGHMPPKNVAGAEEHRMSDTDAAKFKSIIRNHKIDALIFGHVHYFSADTFAGIPMYTTPSSGQTPRFTDLNKYGYIHLEMGKNGIKALEPRYVEFSGPKREYLEAWFVRYIYTNRLREIINILMITAGVFVLSGIISGTYARRKTSPQD